MAESASSWREIRHPDAAALAAGVAAVITDDLNAALRSRMRASLVVPGGSTPGPVFDLLAVADLDWARVDITLSDERWVPATHADSNEAMVRARLLQGRAAAARLLGLYRSCARPSDAVAEIELALRAIARPFDVVLLGLGDDGHFASLFPSRPELHAALDAGASQAAVALDAPAQGWPRLSLTMSALCNTRRLLLGFRGERKHAVLQRALEPGPVDALPVRALLQQALAPLEVHWSPT